MRFIWRPKRMRLLILQAINEGLESSRGPSQGSAPLDSPPFRAQSLNDQGERAMKASSPSTTFNPSDGERVFADERGRLWSAAHAGEVIIFTCISDGRNSGRAIVVNLARLDSSVEDETLRAWLNAAPRIGTLP
jgi:hypothetical protein